MSNPIAPLGAIEIQPDGRRINTPTSPPLMPATRQTIIPIRQPTRNQPTTSDGTYYALQRAQALLSQTANPIPGIMPPDRLQTTTATPAPSPSVQQPSQPSVLSKIPKWIWLSAGGVALWYFAKKGKRR